MILSKADFKAAVDAVTPFARTRTTLPILTHVKVESTGKQVIFTASHIDSQIQFWIDVVGEKFAACIDAAALKKFAQFCDGDVTFTVKAKKAILEFGTTKTRINTLEADAFPMMKLSESILTEIEWEAVASKIAFAAQFCGPNPKQPQFGCVQMNSTGAAIEIFATDGVALGVEVVPHISPDFGVCIPQETARHMAGNFKSMILREDQIELRGPNSIALFKTAPYKPVAIARFLKKQYGSDGKISRKTLLDAINFVSSFSDNGKIRPRVSIQGGEASEVKLVGVENEASAPFKYTGEQIEFNAYPDDFSIFLKSVEADELKIEFDKNDLSTTPIRLTDGARVICTMPVRI